MSCCLHPHSLAHSDSDSAKQSFARVESQEDLPTLPLERQTRGEREHELCALCDGRAAHEADRKSTSDAQAQSSSNRWTQQYEKKEKI